MTDLATDLTLLSIEKFIDLRKRMQEAVDWLDAGAPGAARDILKQALDETDYGEMKVWQPSEEPF